MKIDKIRLSGGSTIELPLRGMNPLTPFVLKASDGLGPTEVNVLTNNGVYHSSTEADRLVVLRVGLQPEWNIGQTPEELRTSLYSLLTPKYGENLKLYLVSGSTSVAMIEGRVSKMEIAAFSKDPEVQVTITCFGSNFKAVSDSNPAPVKTESGGNTTFEVTNVGSAYVGFNTRFTLGAATTTPLVIADESPSGERMTISRSFAAGDIFEMDTRSGSLNVWITAANTTVKKSVLGDLSEDSVWLRLHPGLNRLIVNRTGLSWGTYGILHTAEYLGV